MEPNERQRELIDSIDGIYLVDAGAGTGKTFAVTRRYANVLQKRDVEPGDMLLVTFTNNAAEEMKKKVMDICDDYDSVELRDAPICTFHSLCNKIVNNYGFGAPELLGIDDGITSSTSMMENYILEKQEFMRFMDRFMEENRGYVDYYRIIYDYGKILELIKRLASKGVFPTAEGWYQNGEKYLDGDFEEFKDLFDKANEPKNGGSRQSELRSRLGGYGYKCFPEEAPEKHEVRGKRCKQVPEEMAERAFHEDRKGLKQFIHDVYYEYIKYALNRNYLNFSFLLMFAYVLLCEDHDLREKLGYDYLMIDEFQDTSEIQLKLALLLANRPNICAVGDWKQSIYSFQYADVDNIRRFEERIEKYKEELNQDHERIDYRIGDIKEIPLKKNYRSTQKILDFSEQSLTLEATRRDSVDEERVMNEVTSLESSEKMEGHTKIEAFKSEDEKEAVLEKVQEIVGNPNYSIGEGGDFRKPSYSDIVILTRTSKFGLELQKLGRKYGIPIVYEGGTELFKTDPAILLLAWLRILDYEHSRRGWAVVLEEAGYNLDETKHILDERNYPRNMLMFRKELRSLEDISAIARRVFDRYGISNAFSDKIIEELQNTFQKTYMNLGRLIQFIEDNIENGTRYDVDNSTRGDIVKVRTIHAEKGLEHPIVFISDINRSRFPGSGGGGGRIDYRDPIGLRQKKVYREDNTPYIYDNWRTEMLNRCLSGMYDEERRLMYVAMTRAKRYLFLTSEEERSSPFFEDLNIEPKNVEPELEKAELGEEGANRLELEEPSRKTPLKRPVHSIMEVEAEEGSGMEFGRNVHRFAGLYASGEETEPENSDEENVKEFLDGLEGRKIVEETCIFPLKTENRQIVLKGNIDLINLEGDRIRVIDYKTDRGRTNEGEYRKQLSAYYHAVEDVFPDREITAEIFYTARGERKDIEPLSRNELKDLL